jgi:hypothetical protein
MRLPGEPATGDDNDLINIDHIRDHIHDNDDVNDHDDQHFHLHNGADYHDVEPAHQA